MIRSSAFAGKNYAVYGLARSGMATVEALLASGAEVMAWDQNEAARERVQRAFPGESRGPVSKAEPGPGLRWGALRFGD
ncbi:MAG: hypothetical protein ACXWU4_12555, partial [Allosphingosinicella sp.]